MNIKNIELVKSYFGYWPKFCDAKIISLAIDFQKQNISVSLFYIDADINKKANVRLLFNGAKEIELNELLQQNILDQLNIKHTNDGNLLVSIEACYGLVGSFICNNVEVESISS